MSGAPRRVVAAVPDLMDRSRLGHPEVELAVVGVPGLVAAVAAAERIDLVVVDLARPGALDAAAAVAGAVPVVGFAPHIDGALVAAARAAGIEALPRSTFFRRWPEVGPLAG